MASSRIVWLCYAGMICVALGASLQPVYLTTYAEEFGGLGADDLGRIPAFLFAGFVVGILVSGPLADRVGGKPFAVGGAALSALGLAMLALAPAPHFNMVLAANGVIGLGAGVLDMLMSPIISASSVERRSQALNRLHAFYCLGAIGTLVIASTALRLGIPWRLVVGGIALLPAALMLGFLGADLPPLTHPDHARHGMRVLLRSPRFYGAMLMIFLVGATEEGMAQWLPAYAERALGYSKSTGAAALAAFAVSMGMGRLMASHGIKRFGPYGMVGMAAFLCGLLFLLGAWAFNAPIALAACVLVGLGCSVLWPTILGITADRIPQGGATLFALMAAAGNVGCLAAPWVEGMMAERWNLHTAFFIGACSPFLLTAVVVLAWLADRKAAPKQNS
jgi:fucose permease